MSSLKFYSFVFIALATTLTISPLIGAPKKSKLKIPRICKEIAGESGKILLGATTAGTRLLVHHYIAGPLMTKLFRNPSMPQAIGRAAAVVAATISINVLTNATLTVLRNNLNNKLNSSLKLNTTNITPGSEESNLIPNDNTALITDYTASLLGFIIASNIFNGAQEGVEYLIFGADSQ